MAARFTPLRPDLVRSLVLAEPGEPIEGTDPGRSRAEDHNNAAARISGGKAAEGVAHFVDMVCFEPLWKDCSEAYREMTLENAIPVTEQACEIRPTLTQARLRGST